MSHHYQLQKIILIDSFWPGKTVLLKLDGHTNLSGTNGAGKTTFLRLMQLFWGERPSNIVGGSGSKKGFLDYYLPRTSSYLVFEYQRPYQQICHVLVQSDGRAAKYKFIDAPYRQDFYIAETGFPRDSQSIERLYRPTAEVSKFVPVDDYCAIIQHHQLTGGKKDLRLLQGRYAMAASPINHIEKVIGSVIEKIGDFDAIKQMLIDISRSKLSHNFLQNEDDQQPFQLNKQHIDAWLADLSAAREIEAKRNDFDNLLQTIAELKQTLKSLSHLHFQARSKHKSGQQETEALENSLKELTQQRDRLQQTHNQQLEPKQDALMETNGRLKELDYQIETLEVQKQAFEEQGAEGFAVKGAKTEQYAKQQQDIQAELAALEQKVQQIRQFYEKQSSELQHRHEKQSQSYQQQRSDAELNQVKNLREADTEFQQRKDQLLQDKETRLHPVKEQHAQFLTAFQIKQNEQKNPPVPVALNEQQHKNREALENAGKESKQAYQAQAETQKQYQNTLDHYQQTELELKDKKAELKRSRERHADCQKRLRPEPGSLQYYLEQEAEGWQQNIGRVIAPELLDHTGLAPQWSGQPTQDFYGLGLNLEALAERSYLTADKTQLEQEEKLLFERVGKLGKESDGLEATLQAANKLREQAKSALDAAQRRIHQAEKLEEILQGEANALANQIKAETAKARQQLEQEIQRISADIETCGKKLSNLDDEHQQALQALHNEHLARKGIIESDLKNLLASIDEQMAVDSGHFKQEQERIQQQLNSDLTASGADDTVVKLGENLKETKRLELEARDYRRKAQEYQDWLQKRWQQHPELCRQRDDCQRRTRQLNDEISRLQEDFKRQRAQLNRQIAAQEDELKKNTSLLAQLEQCMEQLRNCPPVCAEDLPEYAAGTLPRLSQDSVKERNRQERDIHGGKQALCNCLTGTRTANWPTLGQRR